MKLKSMLCLLSLLPTSLWAHVFHAPKNFLVQGQPAVFVDFKTAEYNIVYDAKTSVAQAVSTIHFENDEEGMPLFDVVSTPLQVMVDGETVDLKTTKTPDGITSLRVIQKKLAPGKHTLKITSTIDAGVRFSEGGVSSAFWFNDLQDQGFLEAYLPSNLEYDQYQMTFNIDFTTLTQQKIYTNGALTMLDNHRARIEFPATFTSSSLYFHTAPIGKHREVNFSFPSSDGRKIPVIAYANSNNTNLVQVQGKILQNLTRLEKQFGPFLHDTLTVFIAGAGGMEYCGALMTDQDALNHEMTHSYFARGAFMPANGNAGWLDEAITTWSDEGQATLPDVSGTYSNMANLSQYRRPTPMTAYDVGRDFIAHLHYKFQDKGGLIPFLRNLSTTDAFRPMTTEEFILKISHYYSEDLNPLFRAHVYTHGVLDHLGPSSVHHSKMTIKELSELL